MCNWVSEGKWGTMKLIVSEWCEEEMWETSKIEWKGWKRWSLNTYNIDAIVAIDFNNLPIFTGISWKAIKMFHIEFSPFRPFASRTFEWYATWTATVFGHHQARTHTHTLCWNDDDATNADNSRRYEKTSTTRNRMMRWSDIVITMFMQRITQAQAQIISFSGGFLMLLAGL